MSRPTDSAEKVVAGLPITPDELRQIAEYACWDKFEDRFSSDPKKHPAWRAAATIERVERERDGEKERADMHARQLINQNRRIEAAEARVTALEAEKAEAVADEREACARLVEDMPIQIYRDLGIGPAGRSCKPATFEDAAERIRARQALSRSSTEVKNDG